MILKPAQTLAKRLHLPRLDAHDALSTPTVPHGAWHGRLFYALRRPYILTTEDTTFYTVLLEAKGLTTPVKYAEAFLLQLKYLSRLDGFPEIFERIAESAKRGVHFHKSDNRVVGGVMNERVFEASAYMIERHNGDTLTISRVLSRAPTGPLKYTLPVEALTGRREPPGEWY